jgi:diguanylate cyclase
VTTNTLITPTQLAKGALRRLAQRKAEPTPANFTRAYAEEAGQALPVDPPAPVAADTPSARDWATLLERLVRGLEVGHRQWSMARKKESLHHVLGANRSDAARLHKRLSGLLGSWEHDTPGVAVEVADPPAPGAVEVVDPMPDARPSSQTSAADGRRGRVVRELRTTVATALPGEEPRARELADELEALCGRIEREGATAPLADELGSLCQRIQRLFGTRHELLGELQALCRSLTDSITELAEDESWAQGQTRSLRDRLDMAHGVRAVRAARELLDETRERQRSLRTQQSVARQALKDVLRKMLTELGALDLGVGQFSEQVLGYADSVQSADSLEGLAEVVQQMVSESQAVHELVTATRERVQAAHERAQGLEARVRGLEDELRRLSDEAVTDALTRVANRRGLVNQFGIECARAQRAGAQTAPLAVGLLDLDNFKKLNDSLGHAAGDTALQALAARVSKALRPTDHVARYGGEEFVVLLPATGLEPAVDVLTRLQRQLSTALFVHEDREVFVTFSAGVTLWREGESLDTALARADEGMYEAKRSGKNRTCAV